MQKFCREIKAFEADTRGTVTILSAIALTVLLAFASLGAEYGAALLKQSENQRTADSAAFIGASYCGGSSDCSTTATQTVVTAIAQNIGTLNGIPSADVTTSIVTSPSGASGAEAIQVKVSTTKYLLITEIEGAPGSLSLTAFSYGQIGQSASAAACVVALSASGGNAYSGAGGIAFSGGASLSAPNCGVATNNTITAANCGGPWLTAKTLSYNTTAPTPTSPVGGGNCGSAWMNPTTATKAAITDPLASLSGVTTAQARVASNVTPLTAPSAPTVTAPTVTVPTGSGGTTWPAALTNLGYYPTTTVTDSATHCSASFNSSNSSWTISGCNTGTYHISTAVVTSGMSFNFMQSGSSSSVYNFNYSISTGGTTNFGPGTYNFAQAVSVGGGATADFAGGTYNFASGFSIGGGATTTFSGSGNLSISGNLTTGGTTTFGNGSTNISGNLTTAGTTVFGTGALNLTGNLITAGTTTFGGSTYNIGGYVSTAGTTNFGGATTGGTFNVKQYVSTSGTNTFGSGTFNFVQGLITAGATTFGAGTFNFGPNTAACNGEGTFSICTAGGATLEMGSASSLTSSSTFTLTNGVYASGGTTVLMGLEGAGTGADSNSFHIGAATDGNALFLTGGAIVTLADTENGAGVFQLVGNVNSAGGGCTTISAATQHDIKGSFNVSGGTILGAGVYTLTGYFAAGATSGGNVTCNGASVGVSGSGVTIVYDGAYPGTFSASSPTCAGAGFCLGAGFSDVTLTAPTSGTYEQLVVVGPTIASGVTAGTLFTAGSGATLSGAFYTPNGQIYMNGGASAVAGGCLEIVASIIQVTEGASAATACSALNGTTGTSSSIPAGIVE